LGSPRLVWSASLSLLGPTVQGVAYSRIHLLQRHIQDLAILSRVASKGRKMVIDNHQTSQVLREKRVGPLGCRPRDLRGSVRMDPPLRKQISSIDKGGRLKARVTARYRQSEGVPGVGECDDGVTWAVRTPVFDANLALPSRKMCKLLLRICKPQQPPRIACGKDRAVIKTLISRKITMKIMSAGVFTLQHALWPSPCSLSVS
jgi:hypothetical protein